jgi:hypothetical protein
MAAISTADVKQSEGADFWALIAAGKTEAAETAARPARNSRRVRWSCFGETCKNFIIRELGAMSAAGEPPVLTAASHGDRAPRRF